MSPRNRRIALWGTLAIGLLAGLVYAFLPRAVPVDLVTAARGPLVVTLDEEGTTRVRDVFVVSAPVAGRARRIGMEVGDVVIAGETEVAEIEPVDPALLDIRSETEAQAAVRAAESARVRAESEVERARAELDFAEAELQRQQGLRDRGASSVRDLDAADREQRTSRAALATARASLQTAIFELDRARARLVSSPADHDDHDECACIPIRAPVSGRVLRVLHKSEGVVHAGEALIEIGDPSELEIVVDLLSADAVKVEVGMTALIEEWGGGETLQGRVRRVEPYGFTKVSALGIEEQRVNVILDLVDSSERWQRLGHGYRVEARIVVWESGDVLKLPLSAPFRDAERWAVFVEEGGRARLRPIERGRHTGLEVEVRSGLEVGERVVRYPSDRVADGVRITAR
ncbi:MAG: HlyD family efflux transporter periplasmic adaptor subunit [Myxococcales bacterium]|nr:HlyD family efflux transporter periplasmic adaptor subunit [Myxococcales bacterium]